ncbi:serine/threonine protein kinase [Pyxidicoccus xibeiensis]|uniref:serine/threonine protein kinase n=1 Tax=Pyxidicoccus xibeiensis TaxID=2906759 RepID=UPI0020A74E86|nr:serine/threonine-protein kinase [Pyxidicoccus xibeiensis]MCP3136723.1 serine/threonine protein kinase [Pyxidicoccus xibeiensis]
MREAHILHLPPGTDIAGFVLGPLLGAGGCGAVYRAVGGGDEVALKLQSLRRLAGWPVREGTILLRLEHRNVVGFRACGLYPGHAPCWFYLAMEYVRGRTLQQWVDEENPGARRVAGLLLGMARGLEATHAAQVLHRDIKEHNVVVREEDGEAVLVDFGVGDYAGAPRLTHGVLPPGTPRYRSPEALAFRRASSLTSDVRYVATPADDLYALGVVLYWMLTGLHPFVEVETPSQVEEVISHVPVAPHVANPRVPAVLSGLCMRLLSKHPEERDTATALCAAVEEALAGADASWDVPLCEAHPEIPEPPRVWPEDDAAALELWVREGPGNGGPPRRGRRPGVVEGEPIVEPEPEPAPVDVAAVPPTRLLRARPARASGALARPVRGRALLGGAALLAVGVAFAGGLLLERTWRPGAPPLPEAHGEVAPAGPTLESGRAARPPQAAPTAAATASLAVTAQKEDLPVKKTPDTVSSPAPPASARPGVLARALTTAAACTALACPSGPQVRPPPVPEACPPGAVDAMKELGIRMYSPDPITFGARGLGYRVITVREGEVQARVGPDFGALENGTVRGHLFVRGDRVYGRFIEGTTKTGKTFPVCLSLANEDEKGVLREDRSGGPDSARIYSTQKVMAVPSFD